MFLPEFRELLSNVEVQRPIHFWWYEDDNQAMKEQMEAIGISSVAVAVSQIIGREHYIVFNASQHSSDVKLAIGNLAHELSHEAFKALGASAQLPDWPTTKVTHAANERIADLLAIYKGFGLFLLRSRKQIEGDGFEGDYAALTPIEIERFMRRDEESAAKAKLIHAASLKRQGQSEEANATFELLRQQWQRILRRDPQYDFGWYQVAVLCDWLDDKNQAVRAAQTAANLSGNRKYRQFLTNLKLADEERARRIVNDGAAQINTGRLKSANRLFSQAEKIWREQLNEYSDIARVHFELAIVLESQKRIPEAVNEYRLALALDPSNTAYRSKLQNVLHAYEQ